jgi:hypothetical protein
VFDFIKDYGQVTIAAIRAQAAALKVANNIKTQNSSQMYIFLCNMQINIFYSRDY